MKLFRSIQIFRINYARQRGIMNRDGVLLNVKCADSKIHASCQHEIKWQTLVVIVIIHDYPM